MKPHHLRCEYLENPIAVPAMRPRLSWIPPFDQAAWQVVVVKGGEAVWDSGRVESGQTLGIEYDGTPLEPLALYGWRVRVWDAAGRASDGSEPACWGGGPDAPGWAWEPNGEVVRRDGLAPAHWISTPLDATWREDAPPPSPMLRRDFTVTADVHRATPYASALGLYEARLNGEEPEDPGMKPEDSLLLRALGEAG